jgi:hypothetical protein
MGPRVRGDDETCVLVLATAFARGLQFRSRPKQRGRREDRVHAAPAVSCAYCASKKAHTSIQVRRRHPAFPAQWLYGLYRALPGDRALLPPSPVRGFGPLANLTPASRRQDHTTSPYATASLVRTRLERATTPSRPPHPIPRKTTIAIRPSAGRTGEIIQLIWSEVKFISEKQKKAPRRSSRFQMRKRALAAIRLIAFPCRLLTLNGHQEGP